MKIICPPGYHHNGFMATPALGHMMYGYALQVPMAQRVFNKLSKTHTDIYIYVYIYIYMYIQDICTSMYIDIYGYIWIHSVYVYIHDAPMIN